MNPRLVAVSQIRGEKRIVSGRSSDSRIVLTPRLPDRSISDTLRRSSPVTAAGPSPISTEFPLVPYRNLKRVRKELDRHEKVKLKNSGELSALPTGPASPVGHG